MALRDRRGREARPVVDADDSLVERFRRKLLDEIDLAELSKLDATQRRIRLERVMGLLVSREGPVMSTGGRADLIRRVVNDALGLGVLEPLLNDPTITEIMVNGADSIYVERFGRLEKVNTKFTSEAQLMQTIDRIVAGVNRRVDEASPMVDARLPSGERVNVVLPPLTINGPTLTIRRFPRPYPMEELVRRGSVSQSAGELLAALVRARRRLRRHRLRQDDHAERLVGLHQRSRAGDHHRGRRRASAPAGPRHLARVAPCQRGGGRRHQHPRPRP
jgi:pilus assembly protein CpaF